MATTEFDQERAEQFGGEMAALMNHATLALMLSVGHRTGLFDHLATLPPSTSEQIASSTTLNERYVREWLNAMTTARIVEYDPGARTYRLPPEHAMSLTRASGPGNLAATTQFVSMLGGVEDEIVECFKNGGGVPYSRYPKFQALMAESSAMVHDVALVDGVLPLVDGLVSQLESGIDVCDIGCGQGHAINLMAQRFPNSRFTGWDFAEEGIVVARAEAASMDLKNTIFDVRDAAALDVAGAFDFITVFDAVHDQAKPDVVLANINRALRDDGVFLCVDVNAATNVEDNMEHPIGPMLYSISTFHCMTVSLAYGGPGLGTAWGEQLANQMLREAGFANVETKKLPEDVFNVYYVCRK